MAKITKMPSQAIINGFKGTIDYYYYKGIPCARAWPKKPVYTRSQKELDTHAPFAWAASNWNELAPVIREAYRQLATSTNMTPRDIFTKSFINGDTLYLEDI